MYIEIDLLQWVHLENSTHGTVDTGKLFYKFG